MYHYAASSYSLLYSKLYIMVVSSIATYPKGILGYHLKLQNSVEITYATLCVCDSKFTIIMLITEKQTLAFMQVISLQFALSKAVDNYKL